MAAQLDLTRRPTFIAAHGRRQNAAHFSSSTNANAGGAQNCLVCSCGLRSAHRQHAELSSSHLQSQISNLQMPRLLKRDWSCTRDMLTEHKIAQPATSVSDRHTGSMQDRPVCNRNLRLATLQVPQRLVETGVTNKALRQTTKVASEFRRLPWAISPATNHNTVNRRLYCMFVEQTRRGLFPAHSRSTKEVSCSILRPPSSASTVPERVLQASFPKTTPTSCPTASVRPCLCCPAAVMR